MERVSPRYGQVNLDMMRRWSKLAPEEDGPFFALNLMKYREVADYEADHEEHGDREHGDREHGDREHGDREHGEGAPVITGREADDRYTPVDSLRGVGALVVLWADVAAQSGASPTWDRVGMVRYPSRRAFLEMQRRDDFKRQHVHKSAGMDFTIVTSCVPDPAVPYRLTADGELVLKVARVHGCSDLTEPDNGHRVAAFDVEGVIIGDERSWSRVTVESVPPGSADSVLEKAAGLQGAGEPGQSAGLKRQAGIGAPSGVEEMFALRLSAPVVDRLERSLTGGSVEGAPGDGPERHTSGEEAR